MLPPVCPSAHAAVVRPHAGHHADIAAQVKEEEAVLRQRVARPPRRKRRRRCALPAHSKSFACRDLKFRDNKSTEGQRSSASSWDGSRHRQPSLPLPVDDYGDGGRFPFLRPLGTPRDHTSSLSSSHASSSTLRRKTLSRRLSASHISTQTRLSRPHYTRYPACQPILITPGPIHFPPHKLGSAPWVHSWSAQTRRSPAARSRRSS